MNEEIWLFEEQTKNPAMCVLICSQSSTMTFFPEDGHPGMNSLNLLNISSSNKSFQFRMNGEVYEVQERFVLSNDVSVKAAISFFAGARPPDCVEWEEL